MLVCIGLVGTISIVGYGAWTARHILEPISTYASEDALKIVEVNTDQIKFYTLILDENDFVKQANLNIIDTHEQSFKTITIPEDTLLHLPYGLNEFKLASLYKVAQLEKNKDIRSLLNQTLIEYFGVSAQKMYIVKTNSDATSFHKWITDPINIFRLAFDQNWVKENIKTSQTAWDLLNLAKTINGIPAEFTSDVNIVDYEIGSKDSSKDGSEVVVTDKNKLDEYIKKSFQNINILDEKANITVKNSTQTPGLGSKFSRVLTNMGAVVIDISNSTATSQKTKVILSEESWEQSSTMQELKSTLVDYEVITESTGTGTADITIVLGESYAQMINGAEIE
jgi:LytR cell envelope-related transcriptional attenuator